MKKATAMLGAMMMAACVTTSSGRGVEREAVAIHPEDPVMGPADAPVQLVLFADFQ
jgi:hypothetical protein